MTNELDSPIRGGDTSHHDFSLAVALSPDGSIGDSDNKFQVSVIENAENLYRGMEAGGSVTLTFEGESSAQSLVFC